jgi:hypothetical protein
MKMELTHDEQMVCMLAAVKLTAESTKGMDNPQRYQKSLATFEYLVESAEAIGSEWVVAKYFNLPFDPYENKFKVKADVGNAIEVRWTKYVAGQLIIHEYDRPNDKHRITSLRVGYPLRWHNVQNTVIPSNLIGG